MAKLPKYVQLDPSALENTAIATDQAGYKLSDQDFAKRFPELDAGRQWEIDNASKDLGGIDPMYAQESGAAGLGTNFGKTSFDFARNTNQGILAPEQRGRQHFRNLFATNKERQFGGGGQEQVAIAAQNTGNQAAFNQAIANIRTQGANAQTAETAATLSAALNGGAGVAKAVAPAINSGINNSNAYGSASNYLNPTYYSNTSAGFDQPNNAYNYAPSDWGGTYEGTIGGVDVTRAEPVTSTYNAGADSGGF